YKKDVNTYQQYNQLMLHKIKSINLMKYYAINVAVVLGILKLKSNTIFIKYTYVKAPTNAVTMVIAICPSDAIMRCCIAMLLLVLNAKNNNTEIIIEIGRASCREG